MDKTVNSSFPSEFVPKKVKLTRGFMLQESRAFHDESGNPLNSWTLSRTNKSFAAQHKRARGEQSQLPYKELLGLKKAKSNGKEPMHSYRNINYSIFKVAPRILNSVVSTVLQMPLRMTAQPIDPGGMSAKRQYRGELLEFLVNKEEIERLEQLAALGLERPVGADEMAPQTPGEVESYIDMNPKDMSAMEVIDFLKQCFYESKWKVEAEEIVRDITTHSIAGTYQYIDVYNRVMSRKLMIDRCVSNVCVRPDFSDLIRFGEYKDITVGQLRKEAEGWLSEKELMDIASKVAGEAGRAKYSGTPSNYYNSATFSYAYDHEKVTVFEYVFLSTDSEVKQEFTNEAGNRRVKTLQADYVPYRGDKSVNDGAGMSYDEYNKINEGKKRITRTSERNVYRCTWVVDTDYVYNWGLMPNMMRPASNWQEAKLPVAIFSTNFQSAVDMIEESLDQVQLNYLHYQSHLSQSRPPGVAWEKRALARMKKGKVSWDPLKALEMFAESGNFIYDGYDAHDNPLQQKPFEVLPNGLSPGATEHIVLMRDWISTAREQLGLNDITAGITPAERTAAAVADQAAIASGTAMDHIRRCYRNIYERTAQNMYYLLQNNIQRMNPDYISESLGSESYKYFMLNRDLPLIDMGIILEEGPDARTKEAISILLQKMTDAGTINGEDAIRIEMLDNPFRQLMLIKKHRLEAEKRAQANQIQLAREQGEQATRTAVALEQEKQKGVQFQLQQQTLAADAQARQLKEQADQKFLHDMILNRANLADAEKDRATKLLIAMIQSETQKYSVDHKPAPKPVTSK